jgi:hypothetical protein
LSIIILTKLASLNSTVSTPRISNVLVLCMYIYDVWPFPIEKSTNTKLCKFFNITNGCKKHRCNFPHLNRKELKYIVESAQGQEDSHSVSSNKTATTPAIPSTSPQTPATIPQSSAPPHHAQPLPFMTHSPPMPQ